MTSPVESLEVVVAAALWAAAAYKFVSVVRVPGDKAQRYLCASFTALAFGVTLFASDAYAHIDRATGVANVAEPLARTAVLVAAWAAVRMMREVSPVGAEIAARLSTVLLGAALALLWLCFAVAAPAETTPRFTSDVAAEPAIAMYFAVFLGYLGYALWDIMRGSRRFATEATGALRRGLHLVIAGCALGLTYIAVKVTSVSALAVDRGMDTEVESVLARSLALSAGVLIAAGSTWPALARFRRRARAWVTAYVSHRRLYVLWADLYAAFPGLALDPAPSGFRDALRLRDMRFRLYRRVIEIRDGRLQLRPFWPAATPLLSQPAAADEAKALTEALTAQRGGVRTCQTYVRDADGCSLDEEVAWLLHVVTHYRTLRIDVPPHPSTPAPRSQAVR